MIDKEKETLTLLNAIGKSVFVEILYPELIKNTNVSWQELSDKYPQYSLYTDNSKRSRLSHARKILKNKWTEIALRIVSESNNVESRAREDAKRYLSELLR